MAHPKVNTKVVNLKNAGEPLDGVITFVLANDLQAEIETLAK